MPRAALQLAIPSQVKVNHLHEADFHNFYKNVRNLNMTENGFFDEKSFKNLSRIASEMATLFTQNSLTLFEKQEI